MVGKSSIAVGALGANASLFRFVDRSIHHQPPPSSKKFPKTARILSSGHYKHLNRTGTRLFGEKIAVNIRQGRSFQPRLGITVSKKYGKAHDRNRFKRVVREAFRELICALPQNLEINISPRTATRTLSTQALLVELKNLIGQFNTLLE